MLPLYLLAALACIAPVSYARRADTKWYLPETCRYINSMGQNTCFSCNWTGVPICDVNAYWDPCRDKPKPNPCNANEILSMNTRDYKLNVHDEKCKTTCPNQYCYSTTMTYTDKCCSCPNGYRPSVTPPTCLGRRGENVGVSCVGCDSANEVLVGDDQKGWECVPKPSPSAKPPASTPSKSSTPATPTKSAPSSAVCDRMCGKDTWCPAQWVFKTDAKGKQHKLCHCTSGNCKDENAGCPKACKINNPIIPPNCPAVTCPKQVQDKDKCFPNEAGLDMLRKIEGLCTTFYNVCDGVKTIGIGHNCKAHKDCSNLALPLSLCDADRLFRCDVTELMQYVKRLPNYRRLSANQFSALVSLAFQKPSALGNGGDIWKHMDVEAKTWDYKAVCGGILTASKGYDERRKKEHEHCLMPPLTPMVC